MSKSEEFFNAVEKTDFMPTKEIFSYMDALRGVAEEAADETIDMIEGIFSKFLEDNNFWIEYPIPDTDDKYEKILGEHFESCGSEYETFDEYLILFPIMYSRKTTDVTFGYMMMHLLKEDDVLRFVIRLKEPLPKYLKHFNKKNLPKDGAMLSLADEEVESASLYVSAFNDLQLLENEIKNDVLYQEFVEKNSFEFIHDLSRKAGILLVREWAQAKLLEYKYREQFTVDVINYIKNKFGEDLDVRVNVMGEILVSIMTMGGGVAFEYSLEDDNAHFMTFGSEDTGVPCLKIQNLLSNKKRFQDDINDITEKYFEDIQCLNLYYFDMLVESGDLIDEFFDNDEKFFYKINFHMLEEYPEDFPEILEINNDELTKDKLEDIVSKIDKYAAGRPELNELKFHMHEYFYDTEEFHPKEDKFDDYELLN